MEKGRRNSSASEFFSRRQSSTFFQSIRRYSASQVFGGIKSSESTNRTHSSLAQDRNDQELGNASLAASASAWSSPPPARADRWKHLANAVLGNLEEHNENELSLQSDVPCDGSGREVSPVNKRRVFSGKWLPNIRKLSQGKLEKSQSIGGHNARHLRKQISKNKFKVGHPSIDVGMGNKSSHSQSESEDSEPARLPPTGRGIKFTEGQERLERLERLEQPEERKVELHSPMRPILSLLQQDEASSSKPELQSWIGSLPTESTIDLDTRLLDPAGCETNKDILKDTFDEQVDDGDPALKAVAQRQYRLNELLESERMYVSDLEECYCYIKFMRDSKNSDNAEIQMPDDLKEGKDRMVFGNLENIYQWHRDFFLKNLEKCIKNPVELGNLFKRYERKFQMYVVYCQNKPKSEYIVSEHIDTYFEEIRLKLGFKLRLTDLLIKPIQRLTKYHMLLEAILKHSERANLEEEAIAIGHAFHVMTIVPKSANDMMDIGRLQGFEGKIVAQGNLLLRGPLQCTDDPSTGPNFKLKEMTVFLFEQIMIFAETVGKKTQFTSPVYTYKNHIQVNKMALEEKVDGGDPLMFKIKCTDPNRSHMTYICLAEDQAIRDRWRGCIRRQLQVQQDFLRALQDPVGYHNKIGKEL